MEKFKLSIVRVSGPILNVEDYGKLQFVQNTWAGVDSLARPQSQSGWSCLCRVNIEMNVQSPPAPWPSPG